MKKSLAFLILVGVFVLWKFVFSSGQLDFTERAKVLQGLSLAADYKQAVRAWYREHGSLPSAEDWREDLVQVDISKSAAGAIRVGEHGPGVISVHYAASPAMDLPAAVTGTYIDLVPGINADKLTWHCQGTVPEAYMPRKCRVVTEPADSAGDK